MLTHRQPQNTVGNKQPRGKSIIPVKLISVFLMGTMFGSSVSIPQKKFEFAKPLIDTTITIPSENKFEPADATFVSPIISPLLAKKTINKGIDYERSGDMEKAEKCYSEALCMDPENSKAYLLMGSFLKRREEYDKALADLNRAIELKGDEPIYYYERGGTFFLVRDFENAIKDFDQVFILGANYGKKNTAELYEAVYTIRGASYLYLKQFDKAIEDFKQALKIKRKNPRTYYLLMLCYQGMGDEEEADRHYAIYEKLKRQGRGSFPDFQNTEY